MKKIVITFITLFCLATPLAVMSQDCLDNCSKQPTNMQEPCIKSCLEKYELSHSKERPVFPPLRKRKPVKVNFLLRKCKSEYPNCLPLITGTATTTISTAPVITPPPSPGTTRLAAFLPLSPSLVLKYTDPFPNVFVQSFNESGCGCTNSAGLFSFNVSEGYRTFIYDIYDIRNPNQIVSYKTKTQAQYVPPEQITTMIFQDSDKSGTNVFNGKVTWNKPDPPQYIVMQLYKTECGSPDSLNKTVKTCADGNYSFGEVADGTYYIKPVYSGYTFTPTQSPSITVTSRTPNPPPPYDFR